jgi:hypothetical protein
VLQDDKEGGLILPLELKEEWKVKSY